MLLIKAYLSIGCDSGSELREAKDYENVIGKLMWGIS